MSEQKILHIIHVSFIRLQGSTVPWHVTITKTTPPFETYKFGLSVNDLLWNHEDILHNSTTNSDFPRSVILDEEFTLENYKSQLHEIYMRMFWTDGWDIQMAALDQPTYTFLLNGILMNEEIICL